LSHHEAWAEVEGSGVQFDTWLSCVTNKLEVILWTTDDVEGDLKVLKLMLSKWKVVDLEFNFRSFLYTSSFWSDSDVLVNLTLPYKVKVEFSIVSNGDLLGLSLVDEEFTEVKYIRLSCTDFLLLLISKHGVVDLVSLSFDVENEWSGLSLHIAGKVVVVRQLILRLELNFNRDLRLGRDYSREGANSQRVSVVWATLDAVLTDVEAEWNQLLVYNVHSLSVLTRQKKRSELQLSSLEQNIWLNNSANDQEVLRNVFRWDLEKPVGFVLSYLVWGILKDHLRFFTTENSTLVCNALEEWLDLLIFVWNFFPLKLVSLTSWIDSHESLSVLDICSKTLKFNNLKLRVNWSHVLLLSFLVTAWWKLEVNDWSLGNTVRFDNKRILFRV
jgi:hypothetical protein